MNTSETSPLLNPYAKIGKRVKLARIEAELSQAKLGELTGLHRLTISRIELGQRPLDVHELPKFMKVLKLTYQDFGL